MWCQIIIYGGDVAFELTIVACDETVGAGWVGEGVDVTA